MAHKDHYYNGSRLVSATELVSIIDKPFLHRWRESLCCPQSGVCGFERGRQIADEAATLGIEVHEHVEKYLKGEPITETEWGANIVSKLKQHVIKPYLIEPEETLIDNESGLAGSPDFVAVWDDEPVIGDVKVKNQLDENTDDQGCAYRYLIHRKFGIWIDKMRILWCKKRTKSKLVEIVDIDLKANYDNWLALVKRWNKANPKRRVTIYD